MKKALIIFISFFSFILLATKAEASEILFQDDFSETLNKWESPRNNANMWSIVNGKAFVDVTTPSTVTELIPKDEYWDPEWKNIEIEYEYTATRGLDKNLSFKVENTNNSYEFHIVSGMLELSRLLEGSVAFSKRGVVEINNFQTYVIKIQLEQDYIRLFLDDELVFDAIDPSYNNNGGKVGLKVGTRDAFPSTVYFDNVIVRSLDDQEEDSNLNVPYFSQKDPRWDWEIYDHISQYPWAVNPTMSGYGCATTSMAMILNYHGLTTMPDGTLITPQTLNNWLKTQEDGYIKQGLINWNAVTRLTRQIADSNPGKQKLEYKYSQADSEIVRQEISQQRPVIFRVPGHFVVGHGQSYETFNILDPFWVERTSLNNEFYNNSFESLRLFRPSDTDLSYITIASNLEAHVTLEQENSAPLAIDQFIDGGITDQITGSIQPKFMITQLAKPDEGKYLLTIEGEPGDQYAVEIYAYTQNGSVSPFILEGKLEKPQLKTWLHFSKENGSRIEPIEEMPIEQPLDFDNLLNDIHSLYQSGEVKNRPTHAHFISLLTVGKHAPTHHVKSVLLKNIAKQFEKDKHISQQGKDFFIPRVSLVQKLYQK